MVDSISMCNQMGDKLRSQSWGFDLFIASRTPSIEKCKAHSLTKTHIFLSEIMKKSRGKFLPRFDDFVYL